MFVANKWLRYSLVANQRFSRTHLIFVKLWKKHSTVTFFFLIQHLFINVTDTSETYKTHIWNMDIY